MPGINSKGKGWFDEPARHSLAARGIKTGELDESKARALVEGEDTLDPEDWKDNMKTEAGALVMGELVDGVSGDVDNELVAEGKLWDAVKEKGGEIKDKLGDWKDSLESAYDEAGLKKDKMLDKFGDIKEKVGEKVESVKDKLPEKVDTEIGEVVEDSITEQDVGDVSDQESGEMRDELTQKVDKSIDDNNVRDPKRSKEEVKNILESGTPKELTDAVRKGDVVDADALKMTGKNEQELAEHLADFRQDLENIKKKGEILKDLKDEKERYYKKEWKIDKEELEDEWKDAKEHELDEKEKHKKKNELKNQKEMLRLGYRSKLMGVRADYEYSKKLYDLMKGIYKDRKKLVEKLV